jgi:hypothetical protein
MAGPPQPQQNHPSPGDALPLSSTDPGSLVAGPGRASCRARRAGRACVRAMPGQKARGAVGEQTIQG